MYRVYPGSTGCGRGGIPCIYTIPTRVACRERTIPTPIPTWVLCASLSLSHTTRGTMRLGVPLTSVPWEATRCMYTNLGTMGGYPLYMYLSGPWEASLGGI